MTTEHTHELFYDPGPGAILCRDFCDIEITPLEIDEWIRETYTA